MEYPTKRAKIEPVAMDVDTRTRYKRKAEVLDEPIHLTPMDVRPDARPPFIFYPMPRLVRADANALDDDDN